MLEKTKGNRDKNYNIYDFVRKKKEERLIYTM
jgi:hypothetical protein